MHASCHLVLPVFVTRGLLRAGDLTWNRKLVRRLSVITLGNTFMSRLSEMSSKYIIYESVFHVQDVKRCLQR